MNFATETKLATMRRVQGKTGFWYLASPYSKYQAKGAETADESRARLARAAWEAARAAAWLASKGVFVFAPIPHSHPIAETGLVSHSDHGLWLSWDKRIYSNAVGVIVLQMAGYEESLGVTREREDFAQMSRPEVLLAWPQEGV